MLQLTAPAPPLQDEQPLSEVSSDISDGGAYDAAWAESDPSDWGDGDAPAATPKAVLDSAPLRPFAPETPEPGPGQGSSDADLAMHPVPAPLIHPDLPLPLMSGGGAEDVGDSACGDLVAALQQQRNPLALTNAAAQFSDAAVAQQCLQVLLVRFQAPMPLC